MPDEESILGYWYEIQPGAVYAKVKRALSFDRGMGIRFGFRKKTVRCPSKQWEKLKWSLLRNMEGLKRLIGPNCLAQFEPLDDEGLASLLVFLSYLTQTPLKIVEEPWISSWVLMRDAEIDMVFKATAEETRAKCQQARLYALRRQQHYAKAAQFR